MPVAIQVILESLNNRIIFTFASFLTYHYGISRVHFQLNRLFSFPVLNYSGNFFRDEMSRNCHQDLSIGSTHQLLFPQILPFLNRLNRQLLDSK